MPVRKSSAAQEDMAALVRKITPRRREIIRPILEQPRKYVLFSLRGLARELKIDAATLSRTFKAMGFEQFSDFRQYLHDRAIVYSTSLESMQEGSDLGGGTPEKLVRHSLDRDLQNVKQLRDEVDASRIVAVAKKLHESRRIVIVAGDMAASLSSYLDYNLGMLGMDSVAATSPGEIAHRIRHLDSSDAVIGITFGRGLRQTVEGLRQARSVNAFCVGISDTLISPVVKYSDQFFRASTEKVMFADSYVACMALLNTLLVSCASVKRQRTVSILKKAEEEQRTGYRWYSE